MATQPTQVPVSPALRDALVAVLKGKRMVSGMTGIDAGPGPSECIFRAADGEIVCRLGEGEDAVFINLPSGKVLGVPKKALEADMRAVAGRPGAVPPVVPAPSSD